MTLETQVSGLLTDGWVVLPDVVSLSELDRLRAETDLHLQAVAADVSPTVVRREDDTPFRVENIAAHPLGDRSVLAARMNPAPLDLVQTIVGADVISFGSVMVFKLPMVGPAVPLHRDIAEHVFSSDHMWIAAGLYLDDSDEDNGCLWTIPGSHLATGATLARLSEPGLESALAVPLPVRAGSILLHDSRLLHGSKPAVRGGLRRVLYHSYQSADWMRREGLKRSFKPDQRWLVESFALMEWGRQLRSDYEYPDSHTGWEVPSDWASLASSVAPSDGLAVIRYRVTDDPPSE